MDTINTIALISISKYNEDKYCIFMSWVTRQMGSPGDSCYRGGENVEVELEVFEDDKPAMLEADSVQELTGDLRKGSVENCSISRKGV